MKTPESRGNAQVDRMAPPSARQPVVNLAARDLRNLGQELAEYHAIFNDLFVRSEQRVWSEFYLRGQLSDIERKSIEPMVLSLKGAEPAAVRAVQQFISEGAWDDQRVLGRLEQLIAEDLGGPDGAIIVDGSGFPKQGKHSVAVARQYCGHLGKIANCQHGVFAAYASSAGYTFVDRRLYVPEHWFTSEHAELRKHCALPTDLTFTTEPQLALQMVRGIAERAVLPFQWVLGDETYGADPKFLDGVEALGKQYFVEVPVSTRAFVGSVAIEAAGTRTKGRAVKYPRAAPGTPSPKELRQIAAELPPNTWRNWRIKEGSKGSIVAQFAFVRITRSVNHGRPGSVAWAVFRRESADAVVKIFLTNAAPEVAKGQLVCMSGSRWPIETAFEEAKGELGMDHYEVRTWRGWHHHMTQTFLAHHFLVRMRLRGKKSSTDATASKAVDLGRSQPRQYEHRARHRDRDLSPAAQLGSVFVTLTA